MRTLRLKKTLYDGKRVDEAIKLFDPHATLGRVEDPAYWTVTVTGTSPARERIVAGELGNYALGLTVRTRGGKSS